MSETPRFCRSAANGLSWSINKYISLDIILSISSIILADVIKSSLNKIFFLKIEIYVLIVSTKLIKMFHHFVPFLL